MELSATMASLYVGDLDASVDDTILYEVFKFYGTVISVKICRDPVNRASLGYGYVNYRLQEDAERALKNANFSSINGKQCRVMWSNRNDIRRKKGIGNLFIKNIHPDLDSKSLFDAFSSFGAIMSCKVCTDEYGLSRGFGFIQFYDENNAKEALERANGVAFKNKKLVVTKFLSKSERPNARPIDPNKFTNIFVKSVKDVWNLEEFRDVFSKFGEITSCVLNKDKDGNLTGVGFVNFANSDNALKAQSEMNGYKLPNGSLLYVSKFMKKNERKAFLKKEHERRRMELAKKFQDHNLYVKNFDDTFTDEKLLSEFSAYGNITSSQIMKDDKGKSKGFGFVCFATSEEAKAALTALNGKMIDNKALFVAYSQNKEERRKMLEERHANDAFRNPYPYGPMPFIYPQPVFPYVAPPPVHQMGKYPQNPSMGKGAPRNMPNPSGYPVTNARMMYNSYNQHMNMYPSNMNGHRHRGPSNQSRGGHYQGSPLNQRQGQVNNRPSNPQNTQVSVNQVVTEPQNKVKREDKSVKQPQSNDEFGDRVYSMCEKISNEMHYKYDTNSLQKIVGAILEYLSRNTSISSDEEIRKVISDYCNEYSSNPDYSKQ